jgi:hypothetical protein
MRKPESKRRFKNDLAFCRTERRVDAHDLSYLRGTKNAESFFGHRRGELLLSDIYGRIISRQERLVVYVFSPNVRLDPELVEFDFNELRLKEQDKITDVASLPA